MQGYAPDPQFYMNQQGQHADSGYYTQGGPMGSMNTAPSSVGSNFGLGDAGFGLLGQNQILQNAAEDFVRQKVSKRSENLK
jgi:hypothetical protein